MESREPQNVRVSGNIWRCNWPRSTELTISRYLGPLDVLPYLAIRMADILGGKVGKVVSILRDKVV